MALVLAVLLGAAACSTHTPHPCLRAVDCAPGEICVGLPALRQGTCQPASALAAGTPVDGGAVDGGGIASDGGSAGPTPVADGVFDEWRDVPILAQDPEGDASGAFDVTRLQATSRGSTLFLRFDTGGPLNLSDGASSDGTLRIEIGLPAGHHLTIDTRGRSAFRDHNPAMRIGWSALGYRALPTHASTQFEVRVDLAALGAARGATIALDFSGSDSLSVPAPFVLSDPEVAPRRRGTSRAAGTELRVASLNTRFTGLFDPERQAPLRRLIAAVKADVYCFQEEFDSSAGSIAGMLREVDPLGDGALWNAHRADLGMVVASRYPIIPVVALNRGYAAAVVDGPGDADVLVVSFHPPCCGYAGSIEDLERIERAQGVADTIALIRDGLLGAALEPYRGAGVVVVGDWNLVGSRSPLDILEDPAGPALRDWLLRHLIGEDVTTWRGASFPPGRLDVLVYSPNRLEPRNGFVLDSAELTEAELNGLGILATDSLASDHLFLVADFAFLP